MIGLRVTLVLCFVGAGASVTVDEDLQWYTYLSDQSRINANGSDSGNGSSHAGASVAPSFYTSARTAASDSHVGSSIAQTGWSLSSSASQNHTSRRYAPPTTVASGLRVPISTASAQDTTAYLNVSDACGNGSTVKLWSDTAGWNAFGATDSNDAINTAVGHPPHNGSTSAAADGPALPGCVQIDGEEESAADAAQLASDSTNASSFMNVVPKMRNFRDGVQLRILPLGASIVYGQTSPDGNGFRYGLRNQLVYSGNPVNMVGSVHTGTMADGDCEGWPGYTISQVAGKAELSIPLQPNLVLLHAGTNDALQGVDIQNGAARLGTLIDRLFASIPGVTIIASTLLPNKNSATQANLAILNSQIPAMIRARQQAGRKITYVDFSSSYFSTADIGSDGTHPTAAGYLKMAEVWFQGISIANAQNWLTEPATVAGVSDIVSTSSNQCDKIPGTSIGPTQTQMGSGSDDGAYSHVGEYVGGFAGFNNPDSVNYDNPFPEGVFWADIDGDGVDDYVYVASNTNYGIGVALSQGGGTFGTYLYIPLTMSCNRPGVRFADMTGDGRDDLCCLGPDGGLVCWQNTKGTDSRSPNWVDMGTVKTSEGYPQAQVRLADIDGDGRTDYVVFDASTTNIYGWRNGALQDGAPGYWYAMNGVFSGLPGGRDLAGWQFVDLNGDKKDDLVWVDKNGQVTTWINRRGFKIGLSPEWVSHGITHGGSSAPVNVTWGASLGSGRADYALSSIRNGNVYVERWKNQDHGGTMVRGDGARYCDMTGSGSDDYVFIDANGAITLFENDHNWGYWIPWGVVYSTNRVRQEVHLADFNGDGKCDIILVNKANGAATVLQNNFNSAGFTFSNLGVVTGSATCTEGYGADKHDLGVRWHDIDGDRRADFICMQTNGVYSGYLNKGINNMIDVGMIKHAEGKERRNLRLADVDGDGRDDLLYVNMLNGSVTMWSNGGQIPSSGSSFQWNWKGVVSPGGSCRGSCIEFGALYGLGRADYIILDPSTNKAWTWFNVCPDGSGPATPNLPAGAPSAPVPVTPGSFSASPSTSAAASPGSSSESVPGGGSGYVTIDPVLWNQPAASQTVKCYPPCVYVMPPFTLASPTTFVFPPIVTRLTIGNFNTITQVISGRVTTITVYAVSILTTTITVPPVTTSVISWFDVTATDTSTVLYLVPSVTQTSFVITEPRTFYSSSHQPDTRTFYPPPWPGSSVPPELTRPTTTPLVISTIAPGGTSIRHTRGSPGPICTRAFGCGSRCNILLSACNRCWLFCGGPPGINGVDPKRPGGTPTPQPTDPSDEKDCTSSIFSSCATTCAQATPTSCVTRCSTVTGCEGESTETSQCVLLPTGTDPFTFVGNAQQAFPTLGGGGQFGNTYIAAMSTPASFRPTRLKGATTVDVSDRWGKIPLPTTVAPRITTIYVLSTTTIISTVPYSTLVGAMRVTAVVRTQVLAAAFAVATTTSRPTIARRANLIVSQYNLNYYPVITTSSVIDACSAGNFYVYGLGTPKPDSWYQYPGTVAFVSTITANGQRYSSCSYTNPAAPNPGVGGRVFCGATTFQCSPYSALPQYCNQDPFAGYMTSMNLIAQCGVSGATSSVVTSTSVITVSTLVSTLR